MLFVHICVLTAMHLSVEYGERLQRVVVGGLEGGDFLGQRERFILFPSPLEADRLQDLGKKKNLTASSVSILFFPPKSIFRYFISYKLSKEPQI